MNSSQQLFCITYNIFKHIYMLFYVTYIQIYLHIQHIKLYIQILTYLATINNNNKGTTLNIMR